MKKIIFAIMIIAISSVHAQHTFTNNGTNVGINTTNPSEALELHNGNAKIANGKLLFGDNSYFELDSKIYTNGGIIISHNKFPHLKFNLNGYGFSNFALAGGNGYFSAHANKGDLVLRLWSFNASNKMIFTNAGGGDIVMSTGHGQTYNKIRMSIKSDGKIGIGTQSPDELLTVKGIIHSQEVKVDLNGACAPDYVFEEDYNLTSLKDIEIYIKQNKHLPEVPSATEMEENGVELKKMNLLLLKKVEELTLHMIEQNKQIEDLQKKIDALQKQLK